MQRLKRTPRLARRARCERAACMVHASLPALRFSEAQAMSTCPWPASICNS